MDNFRDSIAIFVLVIKKIILSITIAKKKIRYSKLSYNARYEKLVEGT